MLDLGLWQGNCLLSVVKIKRYIYIFSLAILLSSWIQQDTMEEIRRSILTGNTDILARNCHNNIEVITDKVSGSYSRNQAKFVLKQFFVDYPANDFSYLHHGSSPAGAKYAVGKYESRKGIFRVSLKFRNQGSNLFIDSIQFTKE